MGAAQASDITIVSERVPGYVILTDADPSEEERKAAEVLQDYIHRASGVRLNIVSEEVHDRRPHIKLTNSTLDNPQQGFVIEAKEGNLQFTGCGKKGVLYAVYTFIEQVLSAKKLAPGEAAIVPQSGTISVDSNLRIEEHPDFLYREVYSLAETDHEYLDWHKLHSMDQTWGLWGHSVFRLVPTALYWEQHPEYYSYYNGRRQPLQLCLTNPEVLEVAAQALGKMIEENPYAEFWSVSANDNVAVCECENCARVNKEEGSASGTLIRFVNSLAKRFSDRKLVTLAYQNTSWPPVVTKPEKNVYVMLSSIEVYRSEPMSIAENAKSFRGKLESWRRLTPNVLTWDYYTQFTNLLAPFPVEYTFGENLRYLHQNEVCGIFAQMNEFTYGDMLELKMYMLAKLMWNSELDEQALISEFLDSYYQSAAPFVKEYLEKRQLAVKEMGANLDIYGNTVNNQNDYLSPQWMDSYSTSLDKAEGAADNAVVYERIMRVRLPLEYTYLQQSRSYGIHPHGVWHQNDAGKLEVNGNIGKKVDNLYSLAKSIGIERGTEDGKTLEQYKAEWDSILRSVPAENLAAGAEITLRNPYVSEYAIKGVKTLNDRLNGYDDFSYNWLSFDGMALDAVVDFGQQTKINTVSLNFLENQRLWIYKPEEIRVYVSDDNIDFRLLETHTVEDPQENYDIRRYNYTYHFNTPENHRYLRVVAQPLSYNPSWSPPTNGRKPMISCDEIWVN